jgi:DNA (cytosine-5)-methyltransferase 1
METTLMNENPTILLKKARARYTQQELANILDVNVRTVRRWEANDSPLPGYLADVLARRVLSNSSGVGHVKTNRFSFIDLFAGIGGIRLGFERQGGNCVYASEWNAASQKTYLENFPEGDDHQFVGDITQVDANEIPDHDILLAGFPCQPFSIAGVSKKNSLGRPTGFACRTQGTLFFDVARIIDARRPNAFLLENVKNLISHDHGNTFRVMCETLREELGYQIFFRVIDGQHFVPQHRERIIILGFKNAIPKDPFDEMILPAKGMVKLSSILHPQDGAEKPEEPYTTTEMAIVNPKYTLTPRLWQYLQDYARKHRLAGNGFGYGLVTKDDIARTLSARYYKDGSEILISQGPDEMPRRLTPRECARLMGFPDSFRIPVSDTQAYRQFGNSVVVPVIEEAARILVTNLMNREMCVEDSRPVSQIRS